MEIACFFTQIEAALTEKGITLDEALSIASKNGITGLDINAKYFNDKDPEAFVELIEKHGIHVASVFALPECWVRTEEEYNNGLNELKKGADIAKRLKSKYFMAVPLIPDGSPRKEDEIYWREYRRLFSDIAKYGKEIGIQVTVEDFSDKRIPYSSCTELDWLLSNIPELKFTYDSGNFPLTGFDELEGAKRYAEKTVHIHLKDLIEVEHSQLLRDGKYYEGIEIGGGTLKNKEAIKCLKERGFDGAISIELCCEKDIFDRTMKSAKYLKEII